MIMYRDLLDFLRNEEFFIEAEAKPSRMRNFVNEYNATYDEILSLIKEKEITTYFSSNNSKIDTGSGIIEIFTSNDEMNDYSTRGC